MIQDNWTTVAHAQLEAVAQMMLGRLEAEGIEAVTRGNRVAGAAGIVNEFNISWNNPLGGIEVRVRPEDVARAREILAVDEREEADFKDREPMPWAVRATGAGRRGWSDLLDRGGAERKLLGRIDWRGYQFSGDAGVGHARQFRVNFAAFNPRET